MSDNTQKTGKGKRGGKRSTSWKPGQSGNPAGGPKRGGSLKEILDYYDQLSPEEIAALLPTGELKTAYLQMPKGVAMKHLKVLRINAAIMFDPSPGLVNLIHERTDGKVPDELNNRTTLTIEGLNDVLKKVYGRTRSKR